MVKVKQHKARAVRAVPLSGCEPPHQFVVKLAAVAQSGERVVSGLMSVPRGGGREQVRGYHGWREKHQGDDAINGDDGSDTADAQQHQIGDKEVARIVAKDGEDSLVHDE
jgi:hypothetical protein